MGLSQRESRDALDLRNFYRRVYLPKVKETGLGGDVAHVAAQFHSSSEMVRSFEPILLTRGGGEGGEVWEK